MGMGGGGNSFVGILCSDLDPRVGTAALITNDNATYTISVAGTAAAVAVTLKGVGTAKDGANKVCSITIVVSPDGIGAPTITRV